MHYSFRLILILNLCWLLAILLPAQDYTAARTSTFSFDSLPDVSVSYRNHFQGEDFSYSSVCLAGAVMDHRGRLWLNSCGVLRVINAITVLQFDGYEFFPVELKMADGQRLINPAFMGIDREGRLFGRYSREAALIYYDPENGSTQKISLAEEGADKKDLIHAQYLQGWTFALLNDRSRNELQLLSLHQGHIQEEVRVETYGSSNSSKHLLYPSNRTSESVWLINGNLPLHRWERKDKKLYDYERSDFKFPATASENVLPEHEINFSIAESKSGEVYAVSQHNSGNNLFLLDRQENVFNAIADQFPPDWMPLHIYQDQANNLCFLFQDRYEAYRAILQDSTGKRYDYSAVVEGISDITEIKSKDFFQQLFITSKNGLYSIGIRPHELMTQVLTDKWVAGLAELPDGRFIAGIIPSGFSVVDKNLRTALFADLPDHSCLPGLVTGRMFQQVVPDSLGNYWFLNEQKLVRYHFASGQCNTYDLPFRVSLLAFVREDLIALVHAQNRLLFYDISTRTIRNFGPEIPDQFPAKIRGLHLGTNGLLWIPTNSGLWKIDLDNAHGERIQLPGDLNDARIIGFFEDEQQRLWLGTYYHGLQIYNRKTGEIKSIDRRHGLSSNAIMSIIGDRGGDIWATTENGINVLSAEGEILFELHREDGLTAERFERFDPLLTSDGRLLFGSPQGVNIIQPEEMKEHYKKSLGNQIYLTELSYFDRTRDKEVVRRSGFAQVGTIQLPAQHPYLKIKFALSNYLEPGRHRYAYRLEGLDEDWIYLGSQNELNFNRLPPGRYRLLIKGADHRNNWTSEPVSIPIHTHDFFFKQIWFYVLIIGVISFLAMVWIRRLKTEVKRRTLQIQHDKEVIEQQAQELQKLDELKSRFFTNISHELRTPITLITAPVEQLLQKSAGQLGHKTKKSLLMALNNGRKLLRLVEELLDLSRLEADKIQLEESPTPLVQYCRRIFQQFASAAEATQVEYVFIDRWPEEENTVWLDRGRLEKILSNLLSNALKFTSSGGSVHFKLWQQEDNILIEVKDTGRGIAQEDLPHIFDRYFQTKNTSLAEEGGTGIGLALARELTRVMEGSLKAESDWGRGSTFTLSLPYKPAAAVAVPAEVILEGALDNSNQSRPEVVQPVIVANEPLPGRPWLLIVEDNPDMQHLLSSLLSEQYACLLAANGREALELLADSGFRLPALILSDIMMPQMDGYALLERLKEMPGLQKIPVIMLTSKSGEEDKLRALRLGVDDYLTKPFTAEELQLRVNRLITNSRRRSAFQQTDKTPETLTPDADQLWLQKLETAAIQALDQAYGLSKSYLAHEMELSERQLLRRIKGLTGLTIHQYILEIKLQRARYLLEKRTYTTLKEVARACGFSSAGYFSKVYEKHFGVRPEVR